MAGVIIFQVTGLSHQASGTGDQVQVRVQEISPLSSVIDSVIHSFQVAGGGPGWQVAGLPPCLIDSVICHLSSIQRSIQPSIQPSTQSSIQSSVIDSAICHLSSTQSSIQQL